MRDWLCAVRAWKPPNFSTINSSCIAHLRRIAHWRRARSRISLASCLSEPTLAHRAAATCYVPSSHADLLYGAAAATAPEKKRAKWEAAAQ